MQLRPKWRFFCFRFWFCFFLLKSRNYSHSEPVYFLLHSYNARFQYNRVEFDFARQVQVQWPLASSNSIWQTCTFVFLFDLFLFNLLKFFLSSFASFFFLTWFFFWLITHSDSSLIFYFFPISSFYLHSQVQLRLLFAFLVSPIQVFYLVFFLCLSVFFPSLSLLPTITSTVLSGYLTRSFYSSSPFRCSLSSFSKTYPLFPLSLSFDTVIIVKIITIRRCIIVILIVRKPVWLHRSLSPRICFGSYSYLFLVLVFTLVLVHVFRFAHPRPFYSTGIPSGSSGSSAVAHLAFDASAERSQFDRTPNFTFISSAYSFNASPTLTRSKQGQSQVQPDKLGFKPYCQSLLMFHFTTPIQRFAFQCVLQFQIWPWIKF